MQKNRVLYAWLVSLLLFWALPLGHCQEPSKPSGQPAAERPKLFHAYRVEFLIQELVDGKKINTRHYAMDLDAGERGEIKVGVRVPVPAGPAQFSYLDLGTSIDCRLAEFGDDVSLNVHSDFSNIAASDEQRNSQPIVRHINIAGSTLVSLSKPVLVGSADDPNSKSQFQLEATVTRLR